MGRRVDPFERGTVLGLELAEKVLLAGDGPEVIQGRFGDGGDSGDEGVRPVGLDTEGGSVGAVNVDLAVEAGLLGDAHDDRAEAAVSKPEGGDGGVLDLDGRVVEIGPVAGDFVDRAHEPLEQVRQNQAKSAMMQADDNVQELFNNSAGYAIFPNVGKGAYIIGGASGNGVVYQNGTMVGYSNLKQVDVGLQVGGKAYREVLFFKTEEALEDFKDGEYELSGNATAVIIEKGKSKTIKFQDGIAVATMPKAGAMVGVSVAGQRFGYTEK